MVKVTERELDYVMARLGLLRTRDHKRHFKALLRAMEIYEERDAIREGAWKEFGTEDSAHHCRSKAARLLKHAERLNAFAEGGYEPSDPADSNFLRMEAEALDDAYDLVNYAVFFTENVREGRFG